MAKKTVSAQLSFDLSVFQKRADELKNILTAKILLLESKLEKLSHSDVVWLSRVDEFFKANDYITDRQEAVLNHIMKKHNLL